VVPDEVFKAGKNGQNAQDGQKRAKTAILENPLVITLKNFCD